MKTNKLLVASLAIAILAAVASMMVLDQRSAPPVASKAEDRTRSGPVNPPAIPVTTRMEPPAPTPSPRVQSDGPGSVVTQAVAATPPMVRDPRLDNPVFKEELGRYALNFVGADPYADEVWASLIYDESLSESVREDLMEDLNENGFSGGDGSVATADDLPLIESRLALLEAQMRGADEFTMPHLAEAYKDLANMWIRLRGR